MEEKVKEANPQIGAEQAVETIMSIVPEDKRNEALHALLVIRREESFEGPIPHPKMFKEYESILPGSADRILAMAEKQQEHRMGLEKTAVEGQVKSNLRGQIIGFIVLVLGLVLSVVFAFLGMKTFAGSFATGTIVVLVSLFVGGKTSIKKELKDKQNQMK